MNELKQEIKEKMFVSYAKTVYKEKEIDAVVNCLTTLNKKRF